MPMTVSISDDAHSLIAEKKLDLFKKYRISVKLSEITDVAIKHGIDSVDEVFVPSSKIQRLKIVDEKDVVADENVQH